MSKENRYNKPGVMVLGLATLLFFLTGCTCDKKKAQNGVGVANDTVKVKEVGTVVTGELDPATGNFIYDTGEIFEIKLPNKVAISKVGKNSTEAKLYNFLNDKNAVVEEDKTKGWITLDRVYFDTGKSTLTAESNKQIKNIAEILKAYPKSVVKIGGYTDNTGPQNVNKQVSAERAKIVASELIKQGVDAKRVSSEGYGVEHPVCEANDTPECKAKNRRVDIRVFSK